MFPNLPTLLLCAWIWSSCIIFKLLYFINLVFRCFIDSADVQYLTGNDVEQMCRSSALLRLKLKERCRVSQVAIDEVIAGFRSLLPQSIQHIQAGVKAKIAEYGLDAASIDGLTDGFKNIYDPFDTLNTSYHQEKFFREKLGLIVSSVIISLALICKTNFH